MISFQEQIESLKSEVDTLRKRCERVEKEKSDILLRRLANIDTANKYTTGRSSEVLKLQQKVNELTTQNEDLKDEKKHLSLRVKEIESELEVMICACRSLTFLYVDVTKQVLTLQLQIIMLQIFSESTICRSSNASNRAASREVARC